MRKHFVKGKVHGKLTTYYEDGQLADEKEYDTNLQIGEQKSYTKDGVLKYHALYERGKQIKILVYPGDVQ
jgi:antitoxin component YwqK of YwqJK toxin-antitoxin module